MKYVYVGFLVAVALAALSLIIYGIVRWVTRKQQRLIKQQQQMITDLQAAEPEKVKKLRKELNGYDTLVDLILDSIVQYRGTLNLSDLGETISNLIVAKRPERTL